MRVLIITEDFTQDQYIVKPIVEAMLAAVGRPRAKVEVCRDPRFQGVTQAMDWQRLVKVIDRYRGMVDLFVLCVDRDNNPTRRAALDSLEAQAKAYAPDKMFLSEHAWQELEVWLLAGHDLPSAWDWQAIRAEEHPKENYYLPFARQRNVHRQPAQGRSTLAIEAAKRYSRIRHLCPEDIAILEQRIRASLP